MKKGMKALSSFNKVEMGQVFQAMQLYRKKLSEVDLKQFEIAFNRLANCKDLKVCQEVVFDSIEMILITRALRYRGKFMFRKQSFIASNNYYELSEIVENDLRQFQRDNNPLKKAPTAVTVSAGYKIV